MSSPAAIVLAGGGSRRMGGDDEAPLDKLAIDIDGTTMLDRVLAAARPLCGRLVVVGPARPTAVADVGFVQETAPGGGPVPAVAAGLAGLAADAAGGPVLVLAADLPLLVTADLRRLLDRLAADPPVDAVAALDHRGRPNPLLAAYRATALAPGSKRPAAPAALLLPARVATVDLGEEATLNVNTPADLDAAVALVRSRAARREHVIAVATSFPDRYADALGDARLSQEEVDALLDLARTVAHATERRYAPLSTYLAGRYVAGQAAAGRPVAEALADAAALAERAAREIPPSAG